MCVCGALIYSSMYPIAFSPLLPFLAFEKTFEYTRRHTQLASFDFRIAV